MTSPKRSVSFQWVRLPTLLVTWTIGATTAAAAAAAATTTAAAATTTAAATTATFSTTRARGRDFDL
jgi:hypothetical protein